MFDSKCVDSNPTYNIDVFTVWLYEMHWVVPLARAICL